MARLLTSNSKRKLRRLFRPRNWLVALVLLFVSFLILDYAFPLPPAKTYSPVVYDRNGGLLAAYLSDDDKWRLRTDPETISEDLRTAIIAKEDRWFYYHPGVNPLAIVRAAWNNVVTGRRTSGASTITMQVARLLEPKPRTLGNKVREVFRALQLEWHNSKSEILEMYLSYLPYGGNIEGITAASHLYFERPPSQLSLSQATLLAVIPNRPNSLRMDTRQEAARDARNKWLLRFQEREIFPEAQIQAALLEPVNVQRHSLEPLAPHFSQRLVATEAGPEINSTLDLEIQQLSERLLANYIRRARARGISNGAVLVVDNATAEVRAYCGSADFKDVAAAGQVDGIQAIRSPGSTMKPIVYAMAFDQGKLTPDSRLLDLPTNWNGYQPDNYDEKFRGPVSVSYALRHSLNITAVHTLERVGYDKFLDLMAIAGFRTIVRQREQLGLSVILGGCGTTLEELTRMFGAFAHGGRLRPLRFTQTTDSLPQGFPLFSEASAWLIHDILSGIERPDLPNDVVAATNRARIAWKTGTSYGRRDAWSIGFTPRYTIGVWVGNFSGQGVPDLSGTTMAVPLLFDLFGALEVGPDKGSFTRPANVWKRDICLETGHIPSEECAHVHKGFYIRDVSPRKVCAQEKPLYVNADTSIQYCTGCLPPDGYHKASFPIYPPELTVWYETNGIAYTHPPAHNPDCEATFDGPGPQILHPEAEAEFLLEAGAGQEILFQAASDARTDRHYWYVDGDFYRSGAPGEKVFFAAGSGPLRVTCMDDRGRASTVRVLVKEY